MRSAADTLPQTERRTSLLVKSHEKAFRYKITRSFAIPDMWLTECPWGRVSRAYHHSADLSPVLGCAIVQASQHVITTSVHSSDVSKPDVGWTLNQNFSTPPHWLSTFV